jgi:hypothetical protein
MSRAATETVFRIIKQILLALEMKLIALEEG